MDRILLRPMVRLVLVFALLLVLLGSSLPVAAQQNGSLQFDGVADYTRLGNLPLLSSFTYEAWV
ncbi:MAG: hypothetical protein Fur005_24730 [Roseiflexaceae bacterium]